VAASLALVSALAACGFNYPTDRINNITAGANDRDGTVEVLNAAIVSKEANLGSFVATLVNTSQTQQVSVTSITVSCPAPVDGGFDSQRSCPHASTSGSTSLLIVNWPAMVASFSVSPRSP